MPIERQEVGRKFKVGEYEGYIHVGLFPEGDPGDVFVDIAKEGTTLAGLMNAFMIAVSVGIQYGVPLEVFVSKFAHMRFEPSGLTNDPDIRVAKSIPDYIFRWMGKRFLDTETQADLGIMSQAVRDSGWREGYDARPRRGDPAPRCRRPPGPGQTALFNAWEDASRVRQVRRPQGAHRRLLHLPRLRRQLGLRLTPKRRSRRISLEAGSAGSALVHLTATRLRSRLNEGLLVQSDHRQDRVQPDQGEALVHGALAVAGDLPHRQP